MCKVTNRICCDCFQIIRIFRERCQLQFCEDEDEMELNIYIICKDCIPPPPKKSPFPFFKLDKLERTFQVDPDWLESIAQKQ